jgi:predicted esterase
MTWADLSESSMLRTARGCAAALGALALTYALDLNEPAPAGIGVGATPAIAAAHAADPPPPRTFPAARSQIAVPENNPLELYPPRAPATAMPLTVALHGRDMDPLDMCERWNEQGRDHSWLACPAGNMPGGETFDWGGTSEERLAALDAQLNAIDSVYGELVDHDHGDVLVGFSRGAFMARDLAYAKPGRFRGMILLGAAVRLDAAELRAAGVRRVVLASGDKDEARATMQHTALRLAANGVLTRFVSLGPYYHVLPNDLGPVMREALTWVREET